MIMEMQRADVREINERARVRNGRVSCLSRLETRKGSERRIVSQRKMR